jgi:hypothetical protein
MPIPVVVVTIATLVSPTVAFITVLVAREAKPPTWLIL